MGQKPSKASRLGEQVTQQAHQAAENLRARAEEIKPKLRGWLHAATSPLALAAGVVLVVLSPSVSTRIGSATFATTALLLFTVSAVYHVGDWSPRVKRALKRFDHANIFLLIAGSYTPFALLLLQGTSRVWLLGIVWAGALAGVAFKLVWIQAPRWFSTPIYIALGWAAIFYADQLVSGGPAVTTLIVVGGGLYTVGGLVFGIRRPDPFPRWFGYHEIFHTLTIAAFICHYIAASIATYQLR